MKPTNVVAAIIQKKNLYLIAKRNRHKHLGLKWEFPGGKVEKNETFKEALIREIKEELNIVINVHKKIAKMNYYDDEINVDIHYFFCSYKEGKIQLLEHEDFFWAKKKHLDQYDLVAGDKKILYLI